MSGDHNQHQKSMSTPYEAPIHASDCAMHSEPAYPAGECDCGAELTDARMDSIMLLEHLKVAIEHLEHERGNYRLTPVYLESAIQRLKQTARDYDYKLKGAKP